MNSCIFFLPLAHISVTYLVFPLKKRMSFFISSSKAKNGAYWFLKYSFPCFLFLCLQRKIKNGHFYARTIYPLPSSRNHGYFLHNSSMSSRVLFSLSSPHWSSLPWTTSESLSSASKRACHTYLIHSLLIHSLPYFIFTFFLQHRRKKVDKKRAK